MAIEGKRGRGFGAVLLTVQWALGGPNPYSRRWPALLLRAHRGDVIHRLSEARWALGQALPVSAGTTSQATFWDATTNLHLDVKSLGLSKLLYLAVMRVSLRWRGAMALLVVGAGLAAFPKQGLAAWLVWAMWLLGLMALISAVVLAFTLLGQGRTRS